MASSDNTNPFETVEFSKVRGLAERFEQAWDTQQDSSTGIDLLPFLPEAGDPARLPALYELIKTDLSCRWQRGLPTSLEMYVEKFPEIGPLEKVSPRLIYDEYLIRTQHGSPAPLNQYKSRFPTQFEAFENLIQTEQSHREQVTAVSKPEINLGTTPANASPLAMVGNGTLVGGHYTLNKRIGTGGFGEVWLGNDIHGNIPKAIKIITRSVESEESKQELHALNIIKLLNHPYLLRTEGFFPEQERLIVVMELADGSLRESLKKAKKETDRGLPVEKLLVYMKHAAEALDYLHEQSVFHRDIKPENILLVGKIAKVADFGLAKLTENGKSAKTNFAGTSAYSSPETWKGRVTAKSDQYSLAVTYAELRLGRAVFKGNTIYEFMIEHLQSQPSLDPMPAAEQEVLQRALAKEPSDRFETCAEFIQELERAVSGPGSLPATGAGQRSAPSTGEGLTPVSKWNTPVGGGRPGSNPSLSGSTQRSGSNSTSPGKPPSWKTSPSHADLDMQEPEAAPINRRSRRRKGANPILIAVGVVAALAVLVGAASLFARSSLDGKCQELAAKRDFAGAVKAIDDGGLLVSPYKSGLRDDVLKQGLDMAEKAQKSGQLDDLVATTVALVAAFPKDEKGPAILNDGLKQKIPEMLSRGKFAEALALLNKVPFDVPVKPDQLQTITRSWLKQGWTEIDNEDYGAAKKIADDFLLVDPGQSEAVSLKDLATAAESLNSYILKGKFRGVMEKIPRGALAPGAQKLRNDLRDKVKVAWLKHAEKLNDAKSYDEAQQTLSEFTEYFKNDAEGNLIRKNTLRNLFKDYYAQDRYADALAALERTNFEFADLLDEVKVKWRDAEIARFTSGNDGAKAKALVGLGALSKQLASDIELQDVYRKYRGEYLDKCFANIEVSLKAKNYPLAIEQIGKANEFVEGPQKTKLNVLNLLALVDNPETSANDREKIALLLRDVMKQPPKAAELAPVLEGVVKIGLAHPAFAAAIGPELTTFRDIFDDRVPAGFWRLSGMKKADPLEGESGSRKTYADAKRQYHNDEFDKSLRTLHGIDIGKETDRAVRRDYYTLLAKLGEKGALSRNEVLGLKPVAEDIPEIKPYLSKAMTQTIARTWKTWPQGSETWETRIDDAAQADANQPIVLAFKAEALLESGKVVDFNLSPGQGDEKAYVDYVRALAASTKKKDGLAAAARTLEKISPSDSWLVPKRRERASQILQDAAVDLARSPDESRRLFESADDATKAFTWFDKALKVSGKTLKDGVSFPLEAELAFALAAACKAPPAFDVNKILGDDLLAKHRANLSDADRVNLVASNPAAFIEELKAMKKAGLIGVTEIGAVLAVGESQSNAAGETPELNERQAFLYALKGWALEETPTKNKDYDGIYEAYAKASSLDRENTTYLMAKGRSGATAALKAAEKELDPSSKTSYFKQGIKATDPAIKKNLVNDESWADLCILRSQLALELGNAYYRDDDSAELKKSFLDARDYAEKARVAKVPHKKPADVLLALGNAYEDLAQFARIADEKYYQAAADTFEAAGKINPEYTFNAGRARFRWAMHENPPTEPAKKQQLFKAALVNLATATSQPKNPHCPEASYWEGIINFWLGDYPKAYQSYERCINLGRDKDSELQWVQWSIRDMPGVTRARMTSEPERAVKLVDDVERIFRSLKESSGVKKYEQLYSDLSAESYLKQAKDLADLAAKKELSAKDVASFQSHLNKAFELKHSNADKAVEIARSRAYGLKANRKGLNLSARDVMDVHDQTVAAINGIPNMTADQKQKAVSIFETNWNKVQ